MHFVRPLNRSKAECCWPTVSIQPSMAMGWSVAPTVTVPANAMTVSFPVTQAGGTGNLMDTLTASDAAGA